MRTELTETTLIFDEMNTLTLLKNRLFVHRYPSARNLSEDILTMYSALSKLQDKELLQLDIATPYIYISHDVYDAFCCSSERTYSPERAKDFFRKVRMYINFLRAGNGLSGYFAETFPIAFAVGGEVPESIILVGECADSTIDIRLA